MWFCDSADSLLTTSVSSSFACRSKNGVLKYSDGEDLSSHNGPVIILLRRLRIGNKGLRLQDLFMVVCILIGHKAQGTQKQTEELRKI